MGTGHTETITREYPGAFERIVVETPNGDVDLRSTDGPISVTGTKRATDAADLTNVTLTMSRDGDTLELAVEIDEGLFSFGTSPRMDLEVAIPELAAVEADTTNGEITCDLSSVTTVAATATNGNIDCAIEGAEDVTAETINGDVDVTLPAGAEPALAFDAVSGGLSVTGLEAGSVESGSILGASVETTIGAGTTRVEVETVNGDATIRGR
ncbi:hypothetical protein BRC62_03270 [Halobacteriales archaeon QH_10_67_13]|nr:MAG: hypothetical protein BRC62_03270 [Halobacteriales archaeon QH_10_67_13]